MVRKQCWAMGQPNMSKNWARFLGKAPEGSGTKHSQEEGKRASVEMFGAGLRRRGCGQAGGVKW